MIGELKEDCAFCKRIVSQEYEGFYAHYAQTSRGRELTGAVVCFEPLNPVTPGHLLFVPVQHAVAELADSGVFAMVVDTAVAYRQENSDMDYNLIINVGHWATQTMAHLHVHLVPRTVGDGLHLPWTGQKK